jgi:hypothetical protein
LNNTHFEIFTLLNLEIILLLVAGILIWIITHENSGFRGVLTYIFHVGVVVAGWILWREPGVFFFSIPLFILYYYLLFHLSLVVVPASEPANWKEAIQRVRYFFWYTWGFQYPAWVVSGPTGRVAEVRIKGDQFNKWYEPGLVWAHSHQVVGMTTGISFSRIVAPGTLFTKAFERPVDGIIDLRMQMRTFWVDVVSSDGIPYKAQLFITFMVDKEKWDRQIWHRLYLENRLLKDGREPDYKEGSFHFSRLRIRTLLSATGIQSSSKDHTDFEATYWDQMVVFYIEKVAGEVLSQKRFDELWLPGDDSAGASAAVDIATSIINQSFFYLLNRGIRFYSCRVMNFKFAREKPPEPEDVERQQIAAWQADWQRETLETRAGSQAQAELLQQDARAFAYASLLTAVAEGLNATDGLPATLPRKMIAMRFIGALEQILQKQPESQVKNEAASVITSWKR